MLNNDMECRGSFINNEIRSMPAELTADGITMDSLLWDSLNKFEGSASIISTRSNATPCCSRWQSDVNVQSLSCEKGLVELSQDRHAWNKQTRRAVVSSR